MEYWKFFNAIGCWTPTLWSHTKTLNNPLRIKYKYNLKFTHLDSKERRHVEEETTFLVDYVVQILIRKFLIDARALERARR